MGIVKQRCDEPRSYVVDSEGKEYRRNRRHILPVNTTAYTLDPDMDKPQGTERTEQTPAEQCHRQLSPEKPPTSASQQGVEPQTKSPVPCIALGLAKPLGQRENTHTTEIA